jgi:hypothetical protein
MADHIKIGDISPRIQYMGDGVQTVFTYPFPIFADGDIKAYEDGTLQTITTHYDVSGAGSDNGGTVAFVTAPANEAIVTLLRDLTIERSSDFQESGEFRAKVINDELDKIISMVQETEDALERTLHQTSTDITGTLELPEKEARASKVLAFDASGNPIVSSADLTVIESGATDAAASAAAALVSEGNAATDAATATIKASEAAASAALVSAAAGSGPYTTVTILTTGTHNLEIVDSRTYYVCDVSAGDVDVNLPSIGSDEGTTFGFEQSGTANAVNITRDGTDIINGASSVYTLSADTEVVQFIADDNTPDNWIANIQSQTIAGAGLSKSGSMLSLDLASDNTWTGSQRAAGAIDNDGLFDMDAAQNFRWTPSAANVIEFTNEAQDQSGLIYLANPSGYAITAGVEIKHDADFLGTVSAAGSFVISYWCYDGANVAVMNSQAVS